MVFNKDFIHVNYSCSCLRLTIVVYFVNILSKCLTVVSFTHSVTSLAYFDTTVIYRRENFYEIGPRGYQSRMKKCLSLHLRPSRPLTIMT
jgi:hypothetical protein